MTIYSRKNPPKGFYVYAYIRSNDSETAKAGTPYYIGKGKGIRAWRQHRRHNKGVHTPNNYLFIVILEANLTEIGAFALERRYVRWYGRKDLGTGILQNETDGGEGNTGIIQTQESNLKRSHALKGKSFRKNYKTSEKTKQKLSIAASGKTRTEEHKINNANANRGKKRTAEQNEANRQRNSGSNSGRYDHTVYEFTHQDGRREICTRNDFWKIHNILPGDIRRIINGKYRQIKGWSITPYVATIP